MAGTRPFIERNGDRPHCCNAAVVGQTARDQQAASVGHYLSPRQEQAESFGIRGGGFVLFLAVDHSVVCFGCWLHTTPSLLNFPLGKYQLVLI